MRALKRNTSRASGFKRFLVVRKAEFCSQELYTGLYTSEISKSRLWEIHMTQTMLSNMSNVKEIIPFKVKVPSMRL